MLFTDEMDLTASKSPPAEYVLTSQREQQISFEAFPSLKNDADKDAIQKY